MDWIWVIGDRRRSEFLWTNSHPTRTRYPFKAYVDGQRITGCVLTLDSRLYADWNEINMYWGMSTEASWRGNFGRDMGLGPYSVLDQPVHFKIFLLFLLSS